MKYYCEICDMELTDKEHKERELSRKNSTYTK